MSVSDDISVESFTDEEVGEKEMQVNKTKPQSKEPVFIDKGQIIAPPAPVSFENVPLNVRFTAQPQQKSPQRSRSGQDFPSSSQSPGGGFPLLTALMNELLCIQNPTMLQGVHGQTQLLAGQAPQVQGLLADQRVAEKQVSPSQSAAVERSSSQKKLEDINVNIEANEKETAEEKNIFGLSRRGHRKCAHTHTGVPKDKSWLRVIPEHGQKRSKLMFGLTNTQRLRLQKNNPAWLRSMEKIEAASKNSKGDHARRHDSGDELNDSHFSDTLTEVRRQAQKELEKTAANGTLGGASSFHTSASLSMPKRDKSRGKSRKKRSPSAQKRQTQPPSPKPRSPKSPATGRDRRYSDESNGPTSSRPLSVDPSVKNIISPGPGMVPPLMTGTA